jgi:H+-transporting ATPase
LTLNKLSVDATTVLCLGGHTVDDVLKLSALSSQIDSEEAIDVVLVESYHGKDGLWDGLKQSKFVPFNPVDKYTISHITDLKTNESYRLLKGAPQVPTPTPPPPHPTPPTPPPRSICRCVY